MIVVDDPMKFDDWASAWSEWRVFAARRIRRPSAMTRWSGCSRRVAPKSDQGKK